MIDKVQSGLVVAASLCSIDEIVVAVEFFGRESERDFVLGAFWFI